jgi:hypothetical protein
MLLINRFFKLGSSLKIHCYCFCRLPSEPTIAFTTGFFKSIQVLQINPGTSWKLCGSCIRDMHFNNCKVERLISGWLKSFKTMKKQSAYFLSWHWGAGDKAWCVPCTHASGYQWCHKHADNKVMIMNGIGHTATCKEHSTMCMYTFPTLFLVYRRCSLSDRFSLLEFAS